MSVINRTIKRVCVKNYAIYIVQEKINGCLFSNRVFIPKESLLNKDKEFENYIFTTLSNRFMDRVINYINTSKNKGAFSVSFNNNLSDDNVIVEDPTPLEGFVWHG